MLEPYADSVSGAAAQPCRELLAALTDFDSDQGPDIRAAKAAALWWEGVLLLSQSMPASARECFEKALAIVVADLGADHLWTHNCRRMIGRAKLANGEVDEAAGLLLRASEGMSRTGAATNIGVIAAARDAALGLGAVGREREAGELLARQVRRMLETEGTASGAERPIPPGYHLLVARPLAMIAGLPHAHAELAERSARHAMAGLSESGLARLTVGAALYRQQRHADAEPLLAEADEIDQRNKRPPHPVVALYRSACSRAQGDAAQADEWLREADRRAEGFRFDGFTTRSWASLREELGGDRP
ncbi:MAG: tetratricopeptide repeat protein [Phycisphaerales bacterium]